MLFLYNSSCFQIDCADGSDEICEFTNEGECPLQAFQCGGRKNNNGINNSNKEGLLSSTFVGNLKGNWTMNRNGIELNDKVDNTLHTEKVTCISRSKVCDKV